METKKLPILYISQDTILPQSIKEIKISKEESILTINVARERNKNQLIIAPKHPKNDFGILAKIIKVNDELGQYIIIEGIKRIKFKNLTIDNNGVKYSEFETLKETIGKKKTIIEIRNILTYSIEKFEELPFEVDKTEVEELKKLTDSKFIDRFASLLPLSSKELFPLISIINIEKRYIYVVQQFTKIADNSLLPDELNETKDGINKRVQKKVQSQQKEYYLREQIKAAQSELDELTGNDNEFDAYRKRVKNNQYPKHIKEKLMSEIRKLEQTPAQAQEANITRTYIEWLLDLPYWTKTEEIIDIYKAQKILDSNHYGLEKPKKKIIEFLAVKQQNPNAKGSIIALVGPPGTGKTTMAKSIADSLGRKLVKISLGGVKDEAEIRGHRRTYIASQPGKIIQSMKKSGVINPIILLDEIDKMSADFKGDPTSAMLEVLDYEQNSQFQDHYLEEEYDLSNVTFIATANYFQDIPEALIDRLDIIEVSSYTELEKIQIFKKHLFKKVLDETKIEKRLFKWNNLAIKELIRHYTIEAGVRQLYREMNTVARKLLVKKFNKDLKNSITITPKLLQELLGPKKYDYTKIDKKPQTGTVTGLAWTQYGGDILPIEVSLHPGKGEVIITGQLRDVMKESATIALSFIKANSESFGISSEQLKKINEMNIHIHSPDGATPKDGPSAGVTFTTAIISALTSKKVSQYIGMTGEISLRGHVLPIGGLKEKSISAYRSGLKKIFIPKKNIKDLINIPQEVKNNLEIIPIERYSEIFNEIFK
ncbi:MAG: endopeptidase La [Mycoplasmataceae bacterium]|nr:endopeptidase La [Mycoplasmataceae bacterium]